MKEKGEYYTNKLRVYEIYGIPKKDRKKYSMHHIWFKSDGDHWYYEDKFKNRKSNLCPLLKEVHKELHLNVEENSCVNDIEVAS